jgi:hypothetical protein
MRLSLVNLSVVAALTIAAGPANAQRHKLGTVNTETPDGALLQQIGQADDDAKKLTLMEQFDSQHAKHEAIGWVYEQMQASYIKTGQFDKALSIGDKLMALDPDDMDSAHRNLKAAEGAKNPDLILKWAAETSRAAKKIVTSPKPADAEEAEEWKRKVDYASQVETYSEYALFAAALQTADPAKRIALGEALAARNIKSQYMPQVAELQFNAYRQLKDDAKALVFAEKYLEVDQSSEDILAFVANTYADKAVPDRAQQAARQDKVIEYSNKIVSLMESKPKPGGVADTDWNRKKTTMTGLARFLAGSTLYNQKKLAAADTELRAGLPHVEGNDQLKAATLFYAGRANYDMKKMGDALKFFQQCAAIKSPFQATASKNVAAIKPQVR